MIWDMGIGKRQIFAFLLLALIFVHGGLEALGLIVALTPKVVATSTKVASKQVESSPAFNDHCASHKAKEHACAHCVDACYEGGGHVCGMNQSSSAGLVFAAIPCEGAGQPHAPTLPLSLTFIFLPPARVVIQSPLFGSAVLESPVTTLRSYIAVPLSPPPKAMTEVA